jgi:hypothetical protein
VAHPVAAATAVKKIPKDTLFGIVQRKAGRGTGSQHPDDAPASA